MMCVRLSRSRLAAWAPRAWSGVRVTSLVVMIAMVLAACGADRTTRVAAHVAYDDAWQLTSLTVLINGETRSIKAQHDFELVVPDEWAGQTLALEVWGSRGVDEIAYSQVDVAMVRNETVDIVLTLRELQCAVPCTAGATRCEAGGVSSCLVVDGCGVWSEAADCADGETCSAGVCSAECIDECAEGEVACDGNGTKACGQADADECRDWLATAACSPGDSCSGGTCSSTCTDECTAGAKVCDGNGTKACGQADADSCLDWMATVPCIGGATCTSGTCNACTPSWTHLSVTSPGLNSPAMAYDASHSQIVLQGYSTANSRAETWGWNGTAWMFLGLGGPQHSDAMTYDPAGRVLSYYAGTISAWNGTAWSEVATGIGPSHLVDGPESGQSGAWDPVRNQFVIQGGRHRTASYRYAGINSYWLWNSANNSSGTGGDARWNAAAAFDGARSKLVVFGGRTYYDLNSGTENFSSSTAVWSGTGWAYPTPAGPGARAGHAMAYDADRQRVVMFGGNDKTTRFSDTWLWDGAFWTMATGPGPGKRTFPAMAYDLARKEVVLYGGSDTDALTDTWVWGCAR